MKYSGDTGIIKDEQIAYISMEKTSKIKVFNLKNGDEVIDSNDLKNYFGDLKVQDRPDLPRCKVCKRAEC